MPFHAPRAVVAILSLWCLSAGTAGAVPLLQHKASYRLILDGSKSSGQLEDMSGRIEYELTGDACAGYSTLTRQETESASSEGGTLRQSMTSKAWEDGDAKSYRFTSTSEGDDDAPTTIEASVVREGDDGLKVTVVKPRERVVQLKGRILLPTQHVGRVLAAAAAGESVLEAKVYDGASDPAKVYDTLAIIGRASTDEARLAAPARAALAGRTFYPVTVSYFEEGSTDQAPAYVMTLALYDNGVVGNLRIDYGKFALLGSMSAFEALPAGAPAGAPCTR